MATLLVIVVSILVLDSFVSASEAAIFTVHTNRIKQLAEKSKNARILLGLKENIESPIVTLISLSNIITIVGSVFAGAVAAEVFGEEWVGLFAAVLTFLIMLLAEIIPKRIGERYAERVALIMAIPIKAVSIIFTPVTWLIQKVTAPFTLHKKPSVSREEIAFLTDLASQDGVLDEYESRLIQQVFRLSDITAGDMMTPKPFVFSLDGNKRLSEVRRDIYRVPHSRIPVYEKTKDKIVGVVHQRELLRALAEDRYNSPVKDFSHKPLVVPESRLGDDLLRDFLKARFHLAIVVSDFGNMVGIVGLEDVLEEIVGEIVDEKDVEPEFIKRINKNEVLAHGQTHIPDINRFFNTRIKSKKTLNGFVLNKLGHLPTPGETFGIENGVTIRVEEVSASSIEVARLTKQEEAGSTTKEGPVTNA